MLTLALAAALTAGSPSLDPAGPGFDCAKAAAPDEKLVCGTPELARLDRRLAVLYSWRSALADAPARDRERSAQRAWLAKRAACAAGAKAPSKPADRAACVAAVYPARIAELEKATGPVPDAILVMRRAHVKGTKLCEEVDLAWPELWGTTLPGAAAFNDYFAETRPSPDCVGTNDDAEGLGPGYTARSASPKWANQRFVTFERSNEQYSAGAAHPNHASELVTFDVTAGRPIGPDDVFAPAPEARAKLIALVEKRFQKQDEELDVDALRANAFAKGKWAFTATGAMVHFSPYEIASYGAGDFDATFTWEELRPFLRFGAPFPLPKG